MGQTTNLNLKSIVSIWTLALATFTLAGSIIVATVRLGIIYGRISGEHQQMFHMFAEQQSAIREQNALIREQCK